MEDRPAILGNKPVFSSMIPIVRPVLPQFSELASGMRSIIDSGMVTKGIYLDAFEKGVAEHLGVKHAVAVSSCTTGLMLTYHALGLAGEVVVPSFTFMATVSALSWCGLRPVFADVDAATTNLDPATAETAITPDTSAVVVVHNFGNPADIEAFEEIADRRGIKLIFDAAHGLGSLYQTKPVGPQGDAHVFSLSATKLVISGEGGIVATNNSALAAKIRIGREYGNDGSYDSVFAGMNARMCEFSALLGLHSLNMLEQGAQHRNETAAVYHEKLGELPGIGFQRVHSRNRNSYKDFSITIDPDAFGLSRDQLVRALKAENIDTRKYYDPPVHRQSAYRNFCPLHSSLPHTDHLASRSLSLPIWSHMESSMVLGICFAIRRIHENGSHVQKALR